MTNNQPVIAVIDIGSNSIRLQISKIIDRTYKIIDEYKQTVRIGDNVYRTGEFSSEAIETIISVLSNMKNMMDSAGVEKYRAVATASFREAKNGQIVADIVRKRVGIEIEIISGIEEARIMYVAASSYFQLSEGNTLLVDMGGGSTEFTYISYGNFKFSESTPLGCSKLTYNFFKHDPVTSEEIEELNNHIEKSIINFLPLYQVDKVICSGGTLNNISAIYNKRNNLSDSIVKFADSIFTKHFINEISSKSVAERLKINGLEPARADMILSAAILIQILLKKYSLTGFYTLSGGLRAGLTIDLINKMGIELLFQGGSNVDVRYSRLIETGKKYNFEENHALQVTMIAEKIFKHLAKELKLDLKLWLLLEAASLLHDTGQYISYSRHHKHSYYLIMNTDLASYNDKEREIIANVARYHRRAIPKNSHENFANLSSEDKDIIVKLAAILRIADALDRSHLSVIKDVNINIKDNKIYFDLSYDGSIDAEITGFNKKKDLLQAVTSKEVILL